jgi:hypothetical protein
MTDVVAGGSKKFKEAEKIRVINFSFILSGKSARKFQRELHYM